MSWDGCFNLDRLFRRKRKLIILVIAMIIVLFVPSWLMSIGFISGHQGLEAQFNSIYWKDYWYDRTHKGPNPNYGDRTASSAQFFDRVNFDPDSSANIKPNFMASQSPVVVDMEVEPKRWQWAVKVDEYVESGQNETHTWTKTVEVYKEFELFRYRCEWDVNLWLEGTANEAYPDNSRHYMDLELWIKLVPQDFVYFLDNPDEVYFAPALIQLEDIDWYSFKRGKTQDLQVDSAMAGDQDIFPKAEGETLGIFYTKGGNPIAIETELLSYQDTLLDPAIFRNEYWIRFGIDYFKPVSWFPLGAPLLGWDYKFPSVNLDFQVYVFVVGEWTIRLEKEDIIELKPHTPIAGPGYPLQWLFDVLGSPWTWFGIGGFLMIALVVVTFLFFGPTILRIWFRRRED